MDPDNNYHTSLKRVGYIPRKEATEQTYSELKFKCGLEIHQQVKTDKKLFCNCPAGIYQKSDNYDAEIVRHMRPTLSELGEYDGTALMEFKTKKNIIYRIKNETACTYEIDDTPPFLVNRQALQRAMKIALLLKTSIVGELHITRKQYLDGSIPTGFQRTAIIGIEGSIPLSNKEVGIIQLSIEEDSCREISDIGHNRVYKTDRLGMPLIEIVTYPQLLTPDEAAEAGQYLRFLTRSTECVNTGIGAGRQDVNVSIEGGTRVEIKGVARIKWIPELTHIEAFRQKALLEIRSTLLERVKDPEKWKIQSCDVTDELNQNNIPFPDTGEKNYKLTAVNLPHFRDKLSFFTQPGKTFSNEISDRLKVVACLERPNMTFSECEENILTGEDWGKIKKILNSKKDDAQIVFWGPENDTKTALDTIEERCLLAFQGVPNETRKALKDGTTIFERVLPGPDRMYPDTDSAPIPIDEQMIDEAKKDMPEDVSDRVKQMHTWEIPHDTYTFILSRNYFPLLKKLIHNLGLSPVFAGTLLGQRVKHLEGKYSRNHVNQETLYTTCEKTIEKKLHQDILKTILPALYENPDFTFDALLKSIRYQPKSEKNILKQIPTLKKEYAKIRYSKTDQAENRWLMGQLSELAAGNMDPAGLMKNLEGGCHE